MHNPLGYALTIEVSQFLVEIIILEKDRSPRTCGHAVFVLEVRPAGCCCKLLLFHICGGF